MMHNLSNMNYSAIAKKLQIKPGKIWLFYNAPKNYLSLLGPMPEGARAMFALNGDFDGIQLTAPTLPLG